MCLRKEDIHLFQGFHIQIHLRAAYGMFRGTQIVRKMTLLATKKSHFFPKDNYFLLHSCILRVK
jgi:hypothetical protein